MEFPLLGTTELIILSKGNSCVASLFEVDSLFDSTVEMFGVLSVGFREIAIKMQIDPNRYSL